MLTKLNEGGDTMSGMEYTIVADRYDDVSSPFTRTYLTAGPGATVDDVLLQDGCVQDMSDHNSMLHSRGLPRAARTQPGHPPRTGLLDEPVAALISDK